MVEGYVYRCVVLQLMCNCIVQCMFSSYCPDQCNITVQWTIWTVVIFTQVILCIVTTNHQCNAVYIAIQWVISELLERNIASCRTDISSFPRSQYGLPVPAPRRLLEHCRTHRDHWQTSQIWEGTILFWLERWLLLKYKYLPCPDPPS